MAFGMLSLLPALVAVVLALKTRNVLLSLFSAVWIGATMLAAYDADAQAFAPWYDWPVAGIEGLYGSIDPFLLDAVADRDHMKVTLFSLFVAATVGVMAKGGGTAALVTLFTTFAKTRRSGMVATWLAGLVVFFDDYANCLIVGSSMRPLTDRLQISREKLAYIVDSTAAPIASVALISTWIGYEVGLMADGLEAAGQTRDAYGFFIEGIGYRFYSLFTIVFVGTVAFTGRDFGPMLVAEQGGAPARGEGASDARVPTSRAALAIVPIVTLLAVTGAVLWFDGSAAADPGARIFEIIGGADGYDAMLKGSLAAMITALTLAVGMKALSLAESFEALLRGMTTLFEALVVLFLAWSLGAVMGELHAADYLVANLRHVLDPRLLPTLVFLISAATAFATGTSFGTMGIVMPMVLPLSFELSSDPVIALAASGAVLSGACWGDHCSPISDTTVLSSVGTDCELSAHVRTQLPYALVVGVISVVAGTLPVGFGAPLVVVLPLGAIACIATLFLLGRVPARA